MWSHSTIEWDEGSSCTAHDRHLEIFSKPMVLLLSCCTRKLLFRVLQSRRSSACCPLVVQRRYMSHRPGKQLPFFCLASLLVCLFFYKMISDMAVFWSPMPSGVASLPAGPVRCVLLGHLDTASAPIVQPGQLKVPAGSQTHLSSLK